MQTFQPSTMSNWDSSDQKLEFHKQNWKFFQNQIKNVVSRRKCGKKSYLHNYKDSQLIHFYFKAEDTPFDLLVVSK